VTKTSGLVVLLVLAVVGSASADKKAEPTGSAGSADDAPPHIDGPKLVDLGHDTEIDLPAGTVLFERAVAQELMRKGGDDVENVAAAIIKPGADWAVVIEYAGVGYVSDDDADKLDANELFDDFKKGTEAQNEKRKQLGVGPLYLDGWSEQPRYEKPTHHLVWGLKAHGDRGPVINFFTRVLGRTGYLSVNLIDAADRIEQSKADAASVISAIRFKQGARYDDHKTGDKDSGIGLRGLVLGGTGVAIAAKSGLLLKLLLVFKKAIIFIVAGVAGFFRWLFGKKKRQVDVVESSGTPPPSAPPPPSEPPPAPPSV
jgi:uncharacterized membrane-anchored protein